MSPEVLEHSTSVTAGDAPADSYIQELWTVWIDGDLQVRVPASLELMTPYVLLEQERWFETEVDFVKRLLQPGWQVLDIGANYGIYTLMMAQAVGPTGYVFAFEPSAQTADCLAESCALNGFYQVRLHRCALAEKAGPGVLSAESNTELGQLMDTPDACGHVVEVETLDNLAEWFANVEIAFIKMDAEGAEERILAGARGFLARHAPVVMFEIKHGNGVNQGLIAAFRAQGYEIYRHVPGLNALVAHHDCDDPDGYQLNCFAVPLSRRSELTERGLIADSDSAVPNVPTDGWRRAADLVPADSDLRQRWSTLSADGGDKGWAVHRDALNLMMFARDAAQPISHRYAALKNAVQRLRDLVKTEGSIPRLCTLTRGLLDLGQRGFAVQVLQHLGTRMTAARTLALPEPLLPPLAEMDGAQTTLTPDTWLYLCLLEALQRTNAFSGYFSTEAQLSLGQSATNFPGHSTETKRRLALASLSRSDKFPVRCRVLSETGPNAAIWAKLAGRQAAKTAKTETQASHRYNLASVLRPDTDIVIADIGAMLRGEHGPEYQRLLDTGVARIVGFEPDEDEHTRLECAFPAPHIFHRAFIGSGASATYFETTTTMTGSLYEPNGPVIANYHALPDLLRLVARHPVETSRLDDVLCDTEVDMIKIDVQGGELDVFKGGKRALANAVLVHTEVEFVELYKNQPLFGDIDRYLNDAGFQFLKFASMAGRPSVAPSGARMPDKLRTTQLLWADAVYVPKITALTNLPADKLTKLACIAHLLYGANDIAWRALAELDARDGGLRAQRFADQVKAR